MKKLFKTNKEIFGEVRDTYWKPKSIKIYDENPNLREIELLEYLTEAIAILNDGCNTKREIISIETESNTSVKPSDYITEIQNYISTLSEGNVLYGATLVEVDENEI